MLKLLALIPLITSLDIIKKKLYILHTLHVIVLCHENFKDHTPMLHLLSINIDVYIVLILKLKIKWFVL